MATVGEYVGQIFIQTWFLRERKGLVHPKDRRCIDFSRLVIMSCDLARMGNYEILSALWACVLHRFEGRRPAHDPVDLNTRLNVELVKEVLCLIHAQHQGKKLELLFEVLAEGAKRRDTSSSEGDRREQEAPRSLEEHGSQGKREGGEDQAGDRRYLSLRYILRCSYQFPALMFPVLQFQRALRSKFLGRGKVLGRGRSGRCLPQGRGGSKATLPFSLRVMLLIASGSFCRGVSRMLRRRGKRVDRMMPP